MRLDYFGSIWCTDIVNGEIDIIVGLELFGQVFMALSNKEIAFVLREGNMGDLVDIVWNRNKVDRV